MRPCGCCLLSYFSQDTLSPHVFFSRWQSLINLIHVFRDCTYFTSIYIGLNRPKLEENTWRVKCRLNEDFFALLRLFFLSFFPFTSIECNFSMDVCETDLLTWKPTSFYLTHSRLLGFYVYLFIYLSYHFVLLIMSSNQIETFRISTGWYVISISIGLTWLILCSFFSSLLRKFPCCCLFVGDFM